MKAAVYDHPGPPEVLHIAEVPDPVPTDMELLIRVEAISIEGGDLFGRAYVPGDSPSVVGYAASGEVLQAGRAVQGFAVGQKVTTFNWKGSHAELRAVPAAFCAPVPAGLDMAIAAAVPVGPRTAAWALKLGALQPGQTLLVIGAGGGVGVAALQLAAKLGCRVLGTGTNLESLEKLREFGLTDPILTKEASMSEGVRAVIGGNGVDLLIDNVGGTFLAEGISVLKDGGRAVLVGLFGGLDKMMIDAGQLLAHRQAVIGCTLGGVMGDPEPQALTIELLEMARRGELKVPIDASFPLAQAAAAHRRAEERGRIGRVVMKLALAS